MTAVATNLVTVFGGAGFVGRYIVKHLAERGLRIRVAIRRPEKGLFLKTLGPVGQVEVVQANLRHPPSVAQALQGAEAAVISVGVLYSAGAQTFDALHVFGPGNVAQAAQAAGLKRLLLVSAIGANAESDSEYARSKGRGEAAVQAAFPGASIVRPSIVFGPEDGFFNRFGNLARLSPALPLIGERTRFQPVYVGDVGEGAARILERPETVGQTFEFGGPRIYTMRELLELVLRVTGRRRLLLPVPTPLAMLQASVLGLLPGAPLTRDQVRLLQYDNVVAEGARDLAALGIAPTPAEAIIESYMFRYRRGGRKVAPRFG